MSRWYKDQGMSAARIQMIKYLADMVHQGELQVPPLVAIPLEGYKEALESTLKGYKAGKFMFKF
jgi:hypothetical protein